MGTIRGVESMSLALLRLIGEEARKERTGRVIAQVLVDVATYLINEKRDWLNQIESARQGIAGDRAESAHADARLRAAANPRRREGAAGKYHRQLSAGRSARPLSTGISEDHGKEAPGQSAAGAPAFCRYRRRLSFRCPAVALEVAASCRRRLRFPQAGVFVRLWRWLFGGGTSAATPAASILISIFIATQIQRERLGGRDARHDRYRSGGGGSGGDRDRNRDRGDRDRNRDARRDGPRDPRRDGRPRGENRGDSAPRRPEGAAQTERNPGGQRPDAPRAEQAPSRPEAARGPASRRETASRRAAPSRVPATPAAASEPPVSAPVVNALVASAAGEAGGERGRGRRGERGKRRQRCRRKPGHEPRPQAPGPNQGASQGYRSRPRDG